MEQSACSHQLRLLRNLGLVVGERRGRSVVYALYDHHVAELLDQAVYHVDERDEAVAAAVVRPDRGVGEGGRVGQAAGCRRRGRPTSSTASEDAGRDPARSRGCRPPA